MAVRDVVQAAAGALGASTYVEDVFSTYLYTGNGSTQTITNGIDLAGEGGLVWLKARSLAEANQLFDTERGVENRLFTNTTGAQNTGTGTLTNFYADGFAIGSNNISNTSGSTNASWTFRKAPKFFDVVTYTGNGVAGRTVAHNLGSVPGCIIVKSTSAAANWVVYHRSLGNDYAIYLDLTEQQDGPGKPSWNFTNPTSTEFTVAENGWNTNNTGTQYVAYLFAHDAGGFGDDGEQNVISCGSFTTDGSGNATVNLGYEPQWMTVKCSSNAGTDWNTIDSMRGLFATTDADPLLFPNLNAAETATSHFYEPTATGFRAYNLVFSATYIYIAIRRGPMKTPTSGTEVFSPNAVAVSLGTEISTNFPVDMQISTDRTNASNRIVSDRLRGVSSNTTSSGVYMMTDQTAAEASGDFTRYWNNTGFQQSSGLAGSSDVYWNFRRAPGFFDVVCYTGTGSARTVAHNLGVAPELMIVKNRTTAGTSWLVYSATLGATKFLTLNSTGPSSTGSTAWNNTDPTSSVFTVGTASTNTSGTNIVAYLFASCPGVSKVGSYTGTGTTQQIDCGFAARFVLIKSTSATVGSWYVWDSARGIVSGNDPYLMLNSTAAEVTGTDYVDTYSAGFEISSTAPAAINDSGGSFIYLAIA